MNKKHIILLLVVVSVVTLLFFFLNDDKEVVMECRADMTLVDGEALEVYTFYGNGNIVKKETLNVKHYISDNNLIDNYKTIIMDNSTCGDVTVGDGFIVYECNYDLVDSDYYDDIENEKGELLFSTLKIAFENDNFVCNYK